MAILSTNEHILAFSNGSSGPTYSAGDYIDITNDVISVTGLVPKDEYSAFSSHMTECCEEVSGKVDDNSAAITAINNHITNITNDITNISAKADNSLTAVSHDDTLAGKGTVSDPLRVVGSAPDDGYTLMPGAYVSFEDDNTAKTTTINVTGINGFATVASLNAAVATKQDIVSAGRYISVDNNVIAYTGVPIAIVADRSQATGTNILYVVTGAN